MTTMHDELLVASDETIDDAVQHADPLVLRGLVYQLTGDESLASGVQVETVVSGYRSKQVIAEDSDVAMIRDKAAAFLKSCRDTGQHEVPFGPMQRLRRSLSLIVGSEVPAAELELWTEQLGIDPFARGLAWTHPPTPEQLQDFSVIVIGAGMGGLNAAVHLSEAGIPFTVLEKNDEVGGTWYENRYPGARVDTPSRIYTHVFGADFTYPSPYCEQAENEKYVNWIADHFDLRKHITFDTEVSSVVWDEPASMWTVTAAGPDGEHTLSANAIITAVGLLSRPNVPHLDGIERFRGQYFHTARWPASLDVTGKRVAVIGSGCTGYQLVPELAKNHDVEHVYLFQRTPNWVYDTPGYLSPYPAQVNWLDRNFPYFANFVRFAYSWALRPSATAPANEIDPAFNDPHAVSAANKELRDQRLAFMRSKFADRPDLMEVMLPDAPPMSARPVLVDRDYSIYDAIQRDNVTLVPEGVGHVTEDAIVLDDGTEYPVDVIVLATGFRANDFLWPMDIRGRDGAAVEDLWQKDGARAYLGNLMPGFPNFFMLYGPNTNANVGFAAIHLEELVTRFALKCIEALVTSDKHTVEVTTDAYWKYNDALDEAAATKAYLDRRARNYYTNEHGRSATNGAFDARLLWEWLRDPGNRPPPTPKTDDEADIMRMRGIISPYFGDDLTLS
ncbi:NAD(P)/FAD-dependent oxidoreductase [Antricoccus suffuscus]|nr:NAD(P)/FAD-dependent oxidoreductase [Antricoccus suffuscus]